MYNVSITDNERYYLRLLLLYISGATSFDDLKIVEGERCQTFREAANKRGFLGDDKEWERALTQAAYYQMPRQIRQLFGFICVYCDVINPLGLWNKFKEVLLEDYLEQNIDTEIAEQLGLNDIKDIFQQSEKSFEDFSLPVPDPNITMLNIDQINYEREKEIADEIKESLNNAQRSAYEKIINSVQNENIEEKYFFLDGPGGTGKTYLYNAIISRLKYEKIPFITVASTGIAATLLKDGTTAHSRFGIPLNANGQSVSKIKPNSTEGGEIKKARIVIWDEATMTDVHSLKVVDKLLKEIMNLDAPFGGKVMLLGGDFRQCLPIIKNASRAITIENCIKSSDLWFNFKTLELQQNMRTSIDQIEFANWLLKMGEGRLKNSHSLDQETIEIPQSFICENNLVDELFPNEITPENVKDYENVAILCPKNDQFHKLNSEILQKIKVHREGDEKIYIGVDTIAKESDEDALNLPMEFLNSQNFSGMPLFKLHLKVGAIIMILRNLRILSGICNGTRCIVKELMENVIKAEVLTGKSKGEIIFIPRIILDNSTSNVGFLFTRKQFPVTLAFALTINKAQGQTFESIGLFMPQPVFSHGQLYVAFSRAKSKDNIRVKISQTSKQGKLVPNTNIVFTKNPVYKEIFQM